MRSRRIVALVVSLTVASSSMTFAATAFAEDAPTKPTEPPAVPAKDAKEEAMAHWKRGLELYEEQDFNNALIEFRKAYALAPTYKVLYNIGQVCYQLTDYACALRSFERYLKDGGNSIATERRVEVEADIEKLRTRVGNLEIVTTPGADVFVDDVLIGKAPLPSTVVVSAGRRKIVVTLQGHPPRTQIVDVAGTDSMRIELPIVDAGKPAPPTLSPKWTTLSWIGVGAASVLAIAGGVTGVMALRGSNSLEDEKFVGRDPSPEFTAKSDSVKTLSLATDILFGAAAVTLGLTLILTEFRTRKPEGAPGTVSLGVSPMGFALRGEF